MNARVTLMLATVLMIGRLLPAQTPAPATLASQPAAPPQAQGEKPPQPQEEPYSYAPEGRRDPFVSLVSRGAQPTGQVRAGTSTGVGGLTTGEISVRGVVQSRGSYVAMVQGPDGKTYIVHVNDRFVDGVVKQITSQGLVLVQDVDDPLSLVKQREVRKNLRSAEEGK
jgi:Tfp pilus assembly protein PilP